MCVLHSWTALIGPSGPQAAAMMAQILSDVREHHSNQCKFWLSFIYRVRLDALLSTLADLTDILLSYNKFYSFPPVLLWLKGLTKPHNSLPELPEETSELCMLEVLDMLFKLIKISRQYSTIL